MYRERVLDLYHDGFGNRQIEREILSSPGFVQKVIDRYTGHPSEALQLAFLVPVQHTGRTI